MCSKNTVALPVSIDALKNIGNRHKFLKQSEILAIELSCAFTPLQLSIIFQANKDFENHLDFKTQIPAIKRGVKELKILILLTESISISI